MSIFCTYLNYIIINLKKKCTHKEEQETHSEKEKENRKKREKELTPTRNLTKQQPLYKLTPHLKKHEMLSDESKTKLEIFGM